MTAARTQRRRLLGATALLAAAGGIGGYLWQQQRERADAGADALWALRFPRPEGGEIALATLRGRPWLLNFWATWCPPCVREMPDLDRFRREHAARGWEVVGLAIDDADSVRGFLQRVPVSFPIGIAGFPGADLARRLGNSSGGLPFSVVFDRRGDAVQRKLGATTAEELRRWGQTFGD